MNYSYQQYCIDIIYEFIPNLYKYIGPIFLLLCIFGNLIHWEKTFVHSILTCYLAWSLCFVTVSMVADICKYTISLLLHTTCQIYQYTFYLSATLAPNVLIFLSWN